MKTFFKVVGIMICLALMVGFGLCGLMGVVMGASGGGDAAIIGLGLLGILIAGVCAVFIRAMLKTAGKDQPPAP